MKRALVIEHGAHAIGDSTEHDPSDDLDPWKRIAVIQERCERPDCAGERQAVAERREENPVTIDRVPEGRGIAGRIT